MADVRLGRPRFHQNGVFCTVDRATTIFGWANGAAATQFHFASTDFQASNSSTKRVWGRSGHPFLYQIPAPGAPPLKFSALGLRFGLLGLIPQDGIDSVFLTRAGGQC